MATGVSCSEAGDELVGQTANVSSVTGGPRVRHVRAGEHGPLRRLRLWSLATDPGAFGSTYARVAARPAQWWEQWAAQSEIGTSQRTFILDDHDSWLGMALVRLDDEEPGSAILNAMWVAPRARGRRAAALLCDACAAWATDRGCRELRLAVVVGNDAARRAYEAAGFAICGQTTWSRDGRVLDEFVMARPLQAARPSRPER